MTKTSLPAKRGIAGALLVGALSLTGCSAANYQATTHTYSASDGVMFDAEDVALRHLMFIAGEQGGPARMLGLVSNDSAETADVEISVGSFALAFSVEPGEAVNLEHDEEIILPSIATAPGGMQQIDVDISTISPDGSPEMVTDSFGVSVKDGTLTEYRDLLPEGYDPSMSEHLIHGPDTYGGGAAHHDENDSGH